MFPDAKKEAQRLSAAVPTLRALGWQQTSGWTFRSPRGTVHDLSAADLTQTARIEAEGLFLA